jgi:hypothetical protein
MDDPTPVAHVVHLYCGGVYERTLPEAMSSAAAAAFAESYNRGCGGASRRAVVTKVRLVANPPPSLPAPRE